jgi:hypothetical protein
MGNAVYKNDAKTLHIREQIWFNDSTGLTLDFVVVDNDAECPFRLRIYGDNLPFGNREFTIGADGVINGAGTALTSCPFPFDNLD